MDASASTQGNTDRLELVTIGHIHSTVHDHTIIVNYAVFKMYKGKYNSDSKFNMPLPCYTSKKFKKKLITLSLERGMRESKHYHQTKLPFGTTDKASARTFGEVWQCTKWTVCTTPRSMGSHASS